MDKEKSKNFFIVSIAIAAPLAGMGIFYHSINYSKNIADESLKCNQLYEAREKESNIAGHNQGFPNNPNNFYIIYNPQMDACLGLFLYGPDSYGTDYNIVDLNTSQALLDYSSYPNGFFLADSKCQFISQSLMYVENGKNVTKNICEGSDLLNEAIQRIAGFGFKYEHLSPAQ